MRYYPENVLIVADPHAPFTQEGYIDFLLGIKKEKRCGSVLIIGDLVDSYQVSMRDIDPNGVSAKDEIVLARKQLKEWFKAFPEAKITLGNHDQRLWRKAKKHGIPDMCLRSFSDIWQLPDKWEVSEDFIIDNVFYHHGFGSSKTAALTAAIHNRMSTVQGHGHTTLSVSYSASPIDCIFGVMVGCGIDRKAMANAYAKPFKERPIVGCGTVENGENPHVHRMML